jgi:hypothetical protein
VFAVAVICNGCGRFTKDLIGFFVRKAGSSRVAHHIELESAGSWLRPSRGCIGIEHESSQYTLFETARSVMIVNRGCCSVARAELLVFDEWRVTAPEACGLALLVGAGFAALLVTTDSRAAGIAPVWGRLT